LKDKLYQGAVEGIAEFVVQRKAKIEEIMTEIDEVAENLPH